MLAEKTITVFFVAPFLSAILLCSPPSACLAATPKITFGIPGTIECREVTTPNFAKSNPTEKVIEVKFQVSARIEQGEEKQIAWVLYELESLNKNFRVIAFLPNTSLESTTADDYIEIQESASTATRLGGTVNGNISVDYAKAQTSIHGQIDKNQATQKRYRAIAPKALVLASGKTKQDNGVFFKLKPSAQTSLEGEREFACLMVVPKGWRGDCAKISCSGKWNNSGLFSSSIDQCGWEEAEVGLYLEKDDEAKRLAEEVGRVCAAYYRMVRIDAEAAKDTRQNAVDAVEAIVAISGASSVVPRNPKTWQDYGNRAQVWCEKGEYDKAFADYNEALRLNPNSASLYSSRGERWDQKGEYDKAIADFNEALAINPNYPGIYNNRGMTWYRKGEYDKAIADFNKALVQNPKDTFLYSNRGKTWSDKDEYDNAIADYKEAIRLDPKRANVYRERGLAWRMKGEYDKAIADYNKAIQLNPNETPAYLRLAFIYATCPYAKHRDGKKAVENATKAYQLNDEKVWVIDSYLAMAYAESGDFEKAKEWGAKAIELAAIQKGATDKNKAELRSYLELYKQGKPFRHELKKKY